MGSGLCRLLLLQFPLYFGHSENLPDPYVQGLDNTIAADIQSAVVDSFGNISKLSWLGSGFPLGSIATILTFGKAYGIFNVKWLHISSVTVFAIGSAICGAAPNMNALIVGRVIAGIGGAGMYLGNLNLLSINTSLRERRVYMGGVGIVWGAGTILGPVVGASSADSGATWRWAFYINLVIYALMLPALFIMPSYQPKPGTNTLTKFKQLDWVGAFLNTRLWTSFVLATTFGGSTWAWGGGRTIATFVVCLVILIFFALQQSFAILTTPSQLLFPMSFLKSRTIVLLSIATTATGIAQFVPIFCVPLFFQFTHSDTGLQAAVPLMPFIALNSFFIMGQGIAMPFVGYYYPFYIVSGILTTTGGALMYTVNEGTSTSAIYGYSVLIAVGAGLIAQAAYSIVPTKVRPGQVSDAIGFINVAQIGGITISLSVSGDVFQNTAFNGLKKVLSGMEFSEADISAAVAGSQSKVFERMSEEVRNRAIEKIVESIDATYGLVITAGAVVVVTSLWLRRERLFMEVSVGGA
ncbi:related to aflatoxin efflux pump AFLT [Phialocephala subalpina]|uniref:Related to aflatoxin efflux pump AFLT n=1 Tax=Phialocephala subalpina TaxID=576137 RepID=A0A1L7X7Q5_9HELO|nr:related to aflatoxin efflux pump AFLT [Phialocephala subalpina]